MWEYASKISGYFNNLAQKFGILTTADNANEKALESNIVVKDGLRIDKNSGRIL